MYRNKITLKILLFLIFSDILETFTQFCFKKSTFGVSGFIIKNYWDAFIFVKSVFFSGFLWIGFLSVFLTFVIWSTILSKIDLSVAVPIASFSYILVPLASIFLLKEEMSLLDWAGIFFIITGVIIVSQSIKKKEVVIV
jgi:drug/metabolite transporter (DMT)-like permease